MVIYFCEVGDVVGEGSVYVNLGNVYGVFGDFQKVLIFYEKQFYIVKEVGDKFFEGYVYVNFGNVYFNFG